MKELCGKAVALQRWLDDNEARCPAGEIDPDVAIVAGDALSRQALEAMAEDRAIDDLLSALDRALQDGNGALPLDAYLRQVGVLFVLCVGDEHTQAQMLGYRCVCRGVIHAQM